MLLLLYKAIYILSAQLITVPLFAFICSAHVWLATWVVEQEFDPTSTYPSTHGPVAAEMVIVNSIYQHLWCSIHSKESVYRLSASAWYTMLQGYPSPLLVQFVLDGISQGFRIGFTNPPSFLKSARCNLTVAQQRSWRIPSFRGIFRSPGRSIFCTSDPTCTH